jgi:hypothetical protein
MYRVMSINNTIKIHIKYGKIKIRQRKTQYGSPVDKKYCKTKHIRKSKLLRVRHVVCYGAPTTPPNGGLSHTNESRTTKKVTWVAFFIFCCLLPALFEGAHRSDSSD